MNYSDPADVIRPEISEDNLPSLTCPVDITDRSSLKCKK